MLRWLEGQIDLSKSIKYDNNTAGAVILMSAKVLQRWFHPHNQQNLNGDPIVQVPLLDSDGDHQPADEKHVRVF